ncbi:glutathione S-transferase family protein [Phenylobacterium sp.]|uniref:glutathione S-transferase family protein n=1 Tax=Phenylobacterium sp. TaxID=1871053 RepID=UPI002B59AE62|nr:glutathione S-transferase family protein [Phenylobacterium sp.]HLZ75724.1 glutathione S-transferase family protein [Phenylobacterium sp.]
MLLIGQYDSPFVRRVGIALTTYGMAFQHKPWSTFGDADKIAKLNPLRRVPTLVTDDHVAYVDSALILGVIDEMAGARASLARPGAQGRELLRLCGFAAGAAEKGVSLVYEGAFREAALPMWVERCTAQVAETLDLLEAVRAERSTPYLFDGAPSHADVMLSVMWTFLTGAQPKAFDWGRWPALAAHAARCEALPAFHAINQPFKLVTPGEA